MRTILAIGFLMSSALFGLDSKDLEGDWVHVFEYKDGTKATWVFVMHVHENKLSGYMTAVGGRRRAPIEGEVHGTEATFLMDEHNKMSAKLLTADTVEIAFPPDKEGPRVNVFTRKTGFAKTLPVPAQQIHGVDQSRMGPYRALAGLAMAALKRGEFEQAAMFAQILGRVWDAGEIALHDRNADVWLQIDKAMDALNAPIGGYKKTPVDMAKVDALYRTYLEKLKLADYE